MPGMDLHRKLRGAMMARKITHEELAYILGMSATSVSNRMRGIYSWSVDEAWKVLDVLDIHDPAMLGVLFPSCGIDDDDVGT